jgi:hypothetical protein
MLASLGRTVIARCDIVSFSVIMITGIRQDFPSAMDFHWIFAELTV